MTLVSLVLYLPEHLLSFFTDAFSSHTNTHPKPGTLTKEKSSTHYSFLTIINIIQAMKVEKVSRGNGGDDDNKDDT